jgi:hypothetical protein
LATALFPCTERALLTRTATFSNGLFCRGRGC